MTPRGFTFVAGPSQANAVTYAVYVNGVCWYVGASGDFANRYAAHVRTPWYRALQDLGYHFRWYISTQVEEYQAIKRLKPKYNLSQERSSCLQGLLAVDVASDAKYVQEIQEARERRTRLWAQRRYKREKDEAYAHGIPVGRWLKMTKEQRRKAPIKRK